MNKEEIKQTKDNKVVVAEDVKKIEESVEGEKILADAESIIQNSMVSVKSQKIKKFVLFFVVPLLVLVILLVVLSTVFALININSTNILDGISVQGIDVSGLSKEDAIQKISSIIDEHISKDLTVTHGEFEQKISTSQLSVSFDVNSAVDTAYGIGRSGSIIHNNYSILNLLFKNLNVGQNINIDDELFNSVVTSLNDALPDKVVNPDNYIDYDNNNLVITSGKDGVLIDSSLFKQELLSILNDISNTNTLIELPVVYTAASSIDVESIYNSIHKDPVDAYYTTDPYVVYPSSTGLDCNISLDEVKTMLGIQQEEYIIPLKVTYPSVSTSQIGSEAFPDLLSSFSTSFSSSNANRSTNISLAASKISGTVLMPGETFSYNQTVGQRTKAAGFKEAPAYLNGEVVMEYGGGICQVSSTLYNAVLYANLEITERTNHGFKPSYVKPGLDATVSWGGPDFKFTNNRNYPIRLVCDSSGKTLRIYIYGLKTDNDYKVVLDAQYLSTVYATTTYKKDSSLASGESKVVQSGSNGCKTATYKYLYDSNGVIVSSSCISRDTYNPHNKIVAVGP